jgi:carotenoid cleavage dioxygenase-like enzyme
VGSKPGGRDSAPDLDPDPDPGDGSLDTGVPDTGEGDSTGDAPILADTGPDLENRWPGSITEATLTELDVDLDVISGSLPDDMTGHAFVTYPHPMEDGAPQFVGDGMVVRMDFRPDGVGLLRRRVKTPCYYADLATRGTDVGFEARGMARMSNTLGIRNGLNTNFLVLEDRLLMCYDGGRPWEVDPVSLLPITPMGAFEEWTSMMPEWVSWFMPWPFPLVLTSAHPVRDPHSSEVYTINFGMGMAILAGFTRLVRWDGEGPLQTWNLVDSDGNNVEILQSGHQVAVTEDYVVIVDVALRMEWEDGLGMETTRAQLPDATVWIVPRDSLYSSGGDVVCKRVIVPRECTHYLVDYLNPDGEITITMSHNCATDPSEFLSSTDINALTHAPVRSDMVGFFGSGTDVNALGRYVIDVASESIVESSVLFDDECMVGNAALYSHKGMDVLDVYENVYWCSLGYSEELRLERLEELYADYPYRRRAIADMPEETHPGSIFRVYHPTMEIRDRYLFPAGRVAVSPQFVPRTGSTSDTDGYLIVNVLSDDVDTEGSSGDEVWVFDAGNLSQGPVARLGHPDLNLPFTLHTCWMPSIASRTATYQVRLRDDIGEAVSRQSAEVQGMFEAEVYPHFA